MTDSRVSRETQMRLRSLGRPFSGVAYKRRVSVSQGLRHTQVIDFAPCLRLPSLTRDTPLLSRCFCCESQSLTCLSPKGEWAARDTRPHRPPLWGGGR